MNICEEGAALNGCEPPSARVRAGIQVQLLKAWLKEHRLRIGSMTMQGPDLALSVLRDEDGPGEFLTGITIVVSGGADWLRSVRLGSKGRQTQRTEGKKTGRKK